MARPKVHDDALRSRLLEQAGVVLAEGGLRGISLRTLARDCGTSTTAIYSLFGGKTGLLTALLNDALVRFTGQLVAIIPGEDAVADLVRLGAAYRRCALAEPHLFDAMFGAEPHPTCARNALAPLRSLVERAIENDALRPDLDPATAAVTIWATVHGWVTLERRGLLPDREGARFEDALGSVLDGWRR